MKISRLLLFVAVWGGLVPAAQAVRNPQPPPSGIVVHLFGPNSVTSNILPSVLPNIMPGAPPQPGGNPSTTVGAAPATGPGQAMAASAAPPAYVEPTMGQVLHQMFVVGDPNQTPGETLSKGRTTERP